MCLLTKLPAVEKVFKYLLYITDILIIVMEDVPPEILVCETYRSTATELLQLQGEYLIASLYEYEPR